MCLIRVCLIFWVCLAALPVVAEIQVIDDSGQRVVLVAPARNIVSLAPHITELLFAAGAADNVIGSVAGSDFPPQASRIPVVGEFDDIATAHVMSLRPDLVIAWRAGNPPQQIDQLRRLGVPIFYSDPAALMDIANTIMRFAQLAGTEAVAQRTQSTYLQTYLQLKKRYAARPPVPVFLQMGAYPLASISRRHMTSEVIELCGGLNITADLKELIDEVDQATVLEAKPQVIIAISPDGERPAWLDFWQRWPALPAVKHDHLYSIPAGNINRPTPRILLGAQQICTWLEQARSNAGASL